MGDKLKKSKKQACMMKLNVKVLIAICLLSPGLIKAQNVGINYTGATPNNSAILDLNTGSNFTSPNGKGLLVPNIALANTTDVTTIPSPAVSLFIYNTVTAGAGAAQVTPGYYYWTGTTWNRLLNQPTGTATNWLITGNSGSLSGTNFIGTTDNQALDFRTNNVIRARITTKGQIETFNTGQSVFVGESAGLNDDLTNNQNVFVGFEAGKANTTGNLNVFVGHAAGQANTTGFWNTALGQYALGSNTTGQNNTAIGRGSLASNSTGGFNTVMGEDALANSLTASQNTIIGTQAFYNNTSSIGNVAVGTSAGSNNLTGSYNVFIGYAAGFFETGSGKLYIDNSNTTAPLIYGDFVSNLLRVNGTFNINNAYSLPTADGTANYVLQTNGAGVISWIDPTTLSVTETDPQVSSTTDNLIPKWNGTTLVDGVIFDNGTNIGIGTTAPVDKVHVVGNLRIDEGKIPFLNTGESVFIGESAGLNDDLTNNQNVFVGWEAGKANTTGDINVFVGHAAGQVNTTGSWNTALGQYALASNTTGASNTAIGRASLASNVTGTFNTTLGEGALTNSITANQNTIIGFRAFYYNTSAFGNVAIGNGAGENNLTGNNNVFIGYMAGGIETGSNKLYIDNSNTAAPLIYGDFATNLLRVNGTLNVNSAYNLPTVAGTANYVLQTNGAGITSWVNPTALSITETDPQVSAATTNFVPKWNGTTLVDGGVFDNGINVGIGTTVPTQAKLVVNGSANNTLSYGYLNNTASTGTFSGTNSYSIYASQRIAATEFNAFSDKRIKNITGRTDTKKDLEILANIQITNYTYIDSIAHGKKQVKKVIAQELAEVYPNAVSTHTDFIPDMYALATIKDSIIYINNTLHPGDVVKIIFPTGELVFNVIKANEQSFQVPTNFNGDVFVYGKQVNDFHTVDYEALTTLNISATQELLKQIQDLKSNVEYLKAEVTTIHELKMEVENLKSFLLNHSENQKLTTLGNTK
jgi:hypothetical protein